MVTKLVTIVAAVLISACSSTTLTAASTGGSTAASTGGSTAASIGGSTAASTGGSTATSTGGSTATSTGGTSAATGGVAPLMGPVMVRIGSYWIDSTEVSYGQYSDWLATKPTPVQHTECSANTDLTPQYVTDTDQPVTGVDWCDAYAFCAAAGKRLCGSVETGGSTDPGSLNTVADEWFAACSSGGTAVVSDGTATADTTCNVLRHYGSLTQVGEMATCSSRVAGYQGVYDLTGNVEEWTNSCQGGKCAYRGGSYSSATYTCSRSGYIDRMTSNAATLGFRCCKS